MPRPSKKAPEPVPQTTDPATAVANYNTFVEWMSPYEVTDEIRNTYNVFSIRLALHGLADQIKSAKREVPPGFDWGERFLDGESLTSLANDFKPPSTNRMKLALSNLAEKVAAEIDRTDH